MTADTSPELIDQVREALREGTPEDVRRLLVDIDPGEARHLFGALDSEEAAAVLAALEPGHAAEVAQWLAPEQSAEALEQLDAQTGAAIAARLPSDERADLLAEMSEEPREALTAQLPEPQRQESERLLEYDPESAGGLMETELLSFVAGTPVREVIRDLRANHERYAAMGVQYVYVVGPDGRLLGAAPMRDLILAPEDANIESLLRAPPISVRETATMNEIAELFDEHRFMGLPVVDENGRLLGVINRADVQEAEHEHAEEQYRRSQGIVGGEELRTMSVWRRFRRRTLWLGINMLLCLGGAAVIAGHQDILSRAIIVAPLLPVVSATSGNAAMQAAAVSIRELTLGIIEPASWRRVLVHEVGLAMLMAIPLGLAVAALAQAWGASPMIGVAAGLAMAANAVIAVIIGSQVPLLLRRVGVDPALASGPLATTLADITGFFLVFLCVGWMM